tara:strand:+ start:364 stop:630 length:267 start_codon:yes stop_codon:yes gene_type:complete
MANRTDRGIIYFSAPWCQPCKQLGPIIDGLAKEGIRVKKVNIDYDVTFTEKFKIQSVPTLVLTNLGGDEIKRSVGGGDREGILNWFNS